jgi:putative protease
VQSEIALAPAGNRALDVAKLREQMGRVGDTPFVLAGLDAQGLGDGLFLPVSALNHVRQRAIDELMVRRDWAHSAKIAERSEAVAALLAAPVSAKPAVVARDHAFTLSAEVFQIDDARTAAAAGATEIIFDPFLRHPAPSRAKITALAEELRSSGVTLRLRTPTIVRPDDRAAFVKWLALELPILTGHLGLVAELSRAGCDVVADYAVNAFNQVTAAEIFRLGAARITASIELTIEEIDALVSPWNGAGFDTVIYGRPEGMTIEHCVLSAAFDREPTTCRDLCVQKHTNVELTDPAGYIFPVATDSDCRNRLLHSRPIEGSEFMPRLWKSGIRGYRAIFNIAGDPVGSVIAGYRATLDALDAGQRPDTNAVRDVVGARFTRGHFTRAV